MSGNKTAGFTLIELMIGVALWMIVATSLAGAFKQGLHVWKQTEASTPLYQEARVTLEGIAREFQNGLDVPGKNWTGGEGSVSFCTIEGPTIFQVTYRLTPTNLEKVKEPLVPDVLRRPAEKTILTTRPTELAWEYADMTGQGSIAWKSQWNSSGGRSRPAGVRIRLTLYDEKNEAVTFTKSMFLPITEELS